MEIHDNPIKYNGNIMKERKEDKWLGDTLDGAGPTESILSTINERKGRVFNLIRETIAIIEDTRMNK